MICIGPVCIPLNLLLPFLVGVLHRYGFFRWFKAEWVTFRYWRNRCAKNQQSRSRLSASTCCGNSRHWLCSLAGGRARHLRRLH